jgi:hypothetical protein
MKALLVHVGALVVSGALAAVVWTRDEAAANKNEPERVEVWGGTGASVQSVSYEADRTSVSLAAQNDERGRWYVGKVDKVAQDPHADSEHPAVDAPPPDPAKRKLTSFVGVKEAGELADKLAPFHALRALGRVPDGRLAEFGLDKPDATLKVKAGGKEHVLKLGEKTPGGAERYAKYAASGEIFVVPNDVIQTLEFADSRLMERELHGFEPAEPDRLELTRKGKKRELLRMPEKQDAWADPGSPGKPDETAVNWLTKLGRVRPIEYLEKPDKVPGPEGLLARVVYKKGARELGFVELYKVEGGEEPTYLGRSEYGRWYFKVLSHTAEQLDRDADALFK